VQGRSYGVNVKEIKDLVSEAVPVKKATTPMWSQTINRYSATGSSAKLHRRGTGKALWKYRKSQCDNIAAAETERAAEKSESVKTNIPKKEKDPRFGRWTESVEPRVLKTMTPDDRQALAGVEDPDNGKPLIGELELGGLPGVVVVGRNETQVMLDGPDGFPVIYSLSTPYAQGRALASQLLNTSPAPDKLSELGFELIS
jgi:hypothetical protein